MTYKNAASRADIHIKNRELEQRLKDDIKKYDIIYIHAPLGWGKYTLLADFYRKYRGAGVYWLEDGAEQSLEQQVKELPQKEDRIIIIPELERIMELGKQGVLWELISGKKKNDTFLISSTIPIPEELLPFSIFYRVVTYGIEDIKPSAEEVRTYFGEKEVTLYDEDYLRIEKDFRNMPLCLYLLENPLRRSAKGYCRVVREQCFEDVFSYIEVVFFRMLPRSDQDALLHLACFERLDEELVRFVLQISDRQAKELVRRLLMKGSMLEPCGEGWKFERLFGQFLGRIVYKYLDGEELLELYQRAMYFFWQREEWMEALRFAYMLKDAEKMAESLSKALAEGIDYHMFVALDHYFLCLPQNCLYRYPELLMAEALLEAINGNREESGRYEEMLRLQAEQEDGAGKGRQLRDKLLYLQMVRPGGVNPDSMQKILEEISGAGVHMKGEWSRVFPATQLSILHGDKDFCAFFMDGKDGLKDLEYVRGLAEKIGGHPFSGIVSFLQAEVLYEYNRLDESLNLLSRCLKEARLGRDRRMQLLCSVKIADLMIARNQMRGTDIFLTRQMEEEHGLGKLYEDNFGAHQICYHLLQNNQEKLQAWMKEQAPDEYGRFYSVYYYQYLMKAKVYIWMEHYVLARMILQTLLDFARNYHMYYLELQSQVLEAAVYYLEGNAQWKNVLASALALGKRLKFIRVFADEGAVVYAPLQEFAALEEHWAKDRWFREMLTAVRAQMLQYPEYMRKKRALDINIFTDHEKDVIHLLVNGEKNAVIAKKLCVSENTVKYHLKNIYQKLEVGSRSQAINRLSEYHLW